MTPNTYEKPPQLRRDLGIAAALAIVIGTVPEDAIDLRHVAPHEAVRRLERRGVLTGHEEQLIEGEGI